MAPSGVGPRYASHGRVSTDEQDPTLSSPRQLSNAERQVADSGERIVAHYWPRDAVRKHRWTWGRATPTWLVAERRSCK